MGWKLDEIATHIAASSLASSSGASGFYLWKGFLPDSTAIAARAVALVETAGFAPSQRTGEQIENAGLQLLVRGQSMTDASTAQEEAKLEIERITALLGQVAGQQLSSWHYVGIWAEQSPYFLGMDNADRPLYVCNFRLARAAPTTS